MLDNNINNLLIMNNKLLFNTNQVKNNKFIR